MSAVMNILMIALGLALVVLYFNRKGLPSEGKPLIVLCVLLLVGLSFSKIILSPSGITPDKIQDRYDQVCGTYLGQYIAEQYPSSRVVLLTPPEAVAGLEEGEYSVLRYVMAELEGRVASVRTEALRIPPEVIQNTISDEARQDERIMQAEMEILALESSLYMSPRYLSEMLSELASSADVVVFSAASIMEPNLANFLPRRGDSPSLILLYPPEDQLDELFASTSLDAALVYQNNPQARGNSVMKTEDIEKAFLSYYRLITREKGQ